MNADRRRWIIAAGLVAFLAGATVSPSNAADIEFQLSKHPFLRLDSNQRAKNGNERKVLYGKRIEIPQEGPQPIQLDFKLHIETKPKYDPIYLLAQSARLREQTNAWNTEQPMVWGGIGFSRN